MNNNSYWKQDGDSENGTLDDDGVDVTKVAQAAQAAGGVDTDADAEESTDSANMAAVVAAATAATAAAQAGGAEPEDQQQQAGQGVDGEVDSSLLPPVRVNNRGRPLQTTKRAAQNRAAQRAFRQRKEQYIKELESEVKESKESLDELEKNYHQLREYAIKLFYRQTKNDGDLPEPPACIANDVAQTQS